jgi:hypothetical protein
VSVLLSRDREIAVEDDPDGRIGPREGRDVSTTGISMRTDWPRQHERSILVLCDSTTDILGDSGPITSSSRFGG